MREAVGVGDRPQFNYHLGKLTPQFGRKTEAGYELPTAGERVVQAGLAGSFTDHPDREIDIDDPCTQCGATLAARDGDEMLSIACPAWGHGHGSYPFPPGGLHDRSDEEVLRAFDQRVRHLHCQAKDGVCPECNGRMETTLEGGGDCCVGAGIRAVHTCRQCSHELCSAVGLALLDQAAVVRFYADLGIELSDRPYWCLPWCVDDGPVTVRQEEPWRLRVDVARAGHTFAVVVDGDLNVVATDRVA